MATGTVLRGSIALGATIEFPELAQERKVKSMQMFRRPVSRAVRGDRVGICVTSIDAKLLERGIACSPSSLSFASVIICIVRRVRFFRSQIRSGSKLHVTTLHSTMVATCTFFGATELSHLQQDTSYVSDFPAVEWDPLRDFEQQDVLKGTEVDEPLQWALLQFPRPFLCDPRSLLVGSKLDVDVTTKDADKCRIAFYGMCRRFCGEEEKVRLFSWRLKTGIVERLVDVRDDGLCYELIAGDLFSKGGLASFLKMKVRTESGFVGTIVSAYGSNGQFRVKFENGARDVRARSKVTLRFKRYVDDKTHSMAQGEEVDAPVVIPSPPCRESKKEKEGAGQTSDSKDIQTIQAPQIKVTSVHELAAQATEAPAVSSRRRSGVVESVKDAGLVIVQGLFSMEENIKLYIGRTCEGPDGLTGVIIGPFAKMGKCKVHFEQSKDAGQGRAIVAGMEVVLDDPES